MNRKCIQPIMHLIFVCFSVAEEEEEDSNNEEELGGLFKVSRPEKSKKIRGDAMDCSRFQPDSSHDWDQEEVRGRMKTHLDIHVNVPFVVHVLFS